MFYKVHQYVCLFVFCISFPVLTLAQNTADEQAILKVIIADEAAWAGRNYDQWAANWAHKPYVVSFWGGYQGYTHAEGWEALSASAQNFFGNNQPVEAPPPVKDPIITVNGNMASVRMNSNGHMALKVLEKENGTWKLIQNASVNYLAYDVNGFMNRLEGDWILDEATVKVEGIPGKPVGADTQIKKHGSKLSIVGRIKWKNGAGDVNVATQTLDLVPNNINQEVPVTYTWAWDNGGASVAGGLFQQEGPTISGPLANIGNAHPWGNISLEVSDENRIHMYWQMINEKGEENWNMRYDLVRE